ncbi:hypothetical protein, conserved [Trypanosoma brucei gambiense DAL972]|uniref:Uncharacterized protein n=1 Tax=Trypanosoma brucei gambiense (strain MHOM/CI/86/DAL972) TaxID=679716 RepID=C9ZXV7_TRYB9|nr:hypothetical protein, conserved [Trypanosoma brucei gambiense DAL972]CBH14252.1 hypothetical protein, conserved [Trypanosoma brucei gambiense DAL972]|eukprot:XP_011776522.1 hypothetical protein, conserved [Trypanosoma brucei gambiense DAL972]
MFCCTFTQACRAQPGGVPRLDVSTVKRMFPPAQVAQWPPGYLPACGVAHFLSPDGVPLADVIDCHRDMRADRRCQLQRDFAADYTMWCRATLMDFVRRLNERDRRRMKRFCMRDRTMHDAEVRELLGLAPYVAPRAQPSQETVGTSAAPKWGSCYEFTPFAVTQGHAMLPVSQCNGPDARMYLSTFPQIRNIMHTEFDSMGPHSIWYGRLAWLLNNSGLLPFPVVPVQPPEYAARRQRRNKHLLSRDGFVSELFGHGVLPESFTTVFPCETITVPDALRKYRPCVVLVEPHVDRDWLCDLRGFYTTREVVLLGSVDSPAMCSFGFPFLSFGVMAGPTTYWAYNEALQRVSAAERIQMPVDPPHVSQGYARRPIDNISSYLISPNDCYAFSYQHRCLSFIRKECPISRGRYTEAVCNTSPELCPSNMVAGEKHQI